MNKHYIILGKGYVGNAVNTRFVNEGKSLSFLSRKDVDYTDPLKLSQFIEFKQQSTTEIPPSSFTIINCAGYTGNPNVDACELDYNKPGVYALNAQLPITLAQVAMSYNNVDLIHISSGCIYSGYEKIYSETDVPNFGIYNPNSSFYSKTKHIAELGLQQFKTGAILRVRMIFGDDESPRNLLNKILKYNNLIALENSMTNVNDLAAFISSFTDRGLERKHDIYNVVNEGSLSLRVITGIMRKYHKGRSDWTFTDQVEDLKTKAGRSNCVLDTQKIRSLGLALPGVTASMDDCIKKIKN